jgi:hypothetical protein
MWWVLWLSCRRGPPEAEVPEPAPVEQPAPSQAEPVPPAPELPGALRGDGQSCLLDTECSSGFCEGQGCGEDQPGVCVGSMRRCTRDLRPYCGCDGKTFMASGTCPNRRYASPGPCP